MIRSTLFALFDCISIQFRYMSLCDLSCLLLLVLACISYFELYLTLNDWSRGVQ